jgi:hypothetical protein
MILLYDLVHSALARALIPVNTCEIETFIKHLMSRGRTLPVKCSCVQRSLLYYGSVNWCITLAIETCSLYHLER